MISLLGGVEDDEGIEVFGSAEGVYSEAGQRRRAGGGHLPQGWDQSGDLLQLEEALRGHAASGNVEGVAVVVAF